MKLKILQTHPATYIIVFFFPLHTLYTLLHSPDISPLLEVVWKLNMCVGMFRDCAFSPTWTQSSYRKLDLLNFLHTLFSTLLYFRSAKNAVLSFSNKCHVCTIVSYPCGCKFIEICCDEIQKKQRLIVVTFRLKYCVHILGWDAPDLSRELLPTERRQWECQIKPLPRAFPAATSKSHGVTVKCSVNDSLSYWWHTGQTTIISYSIRCICPCLG